MKWRTNCSARLTTLVLVSLAVLLLNPGFATAVLAHPPFANASITGTYALIDTGRTGGQFPKAQAGIGVVHYDGNGNFSGRAFQDVPLFGKQLFVEAQLSGTYAVQPDGTGTSKLTITLRLPGNPVEKQDLSLVIIKARTIGQRQVAEEFSFIQKQLGIPGTLTPFVATRLPDDGKFSTASLNGKYAFTLAGDGGVSPEAGVGVVSYDGVGGASGIATVNLPGTPPDRKFVTKLLRATYTLDADGLGTITQPGQSDVAFVVTRAKMMDGVKVAKRAFFLVKDLDPATGSLLTGTITKQTQD
jgi:hypothetical protein